METTVLFTSEARLEKKEIILKAIITTKNVSAYKVGKT